MASLDFERRLTCAQKLNDHNYRGLGYRANPNEPTCACPQIASAKKTKKKKQQPSFLDCRSSYMDRCCSNVQQRKDANDPGMSSAHFMPTHCVLSTKNDEVYNRETYNSKERRIRMRGGGSGEQLGFFNGRSDFTWYNSRFMMPVQRLVGGGTGETNPTACCGKSKGMQQRKTVENNQEYIDSLKWDRINPGHLAANICQLKNNEDTTMCSCTDKLPTDSMMKKKGQGVCMKKPCLGADCLIKAFNDAQDFVDNIGKELESTGRRIIDSPYFGQHEAKERKSENTSNMHSTQNRESSKLNYNASSGAYTPIQPRKSQPVQEGIATFPDSSALPFSKPKKKDEKIEKPKETETYAQSIQKFEETPCGQPKCKSRPKPATTELENIDCNKKLTDDQIQKSNKSRIVSHYKSPKEDKFIYSFGNSYPTSVYGHKKCNFIRTLVPAHMGWMWNQFQAMGKIKQHARWRPGAISEHIRDILKEAREGFFKEVGTSHSSPSKTKKGKSKSMSFKTIKKNNEIEEETDFPPTLHIHRKDGVYYVTMYPIRPETSEVPRLDQPINPLQFKIVKSQDSLASSSTASDMEIEFSPPAAVNRLKRKPNVIHVETQVKQQDILVALGIAPKKKDKDNDKKKDKDTKPKKGT